jgi:hypothetical protein
VKIAALPLLAALALAACISSAAPAPDPAPLAQRIMQLDQKTQWRAVSETPIPFDTHHPQGMVRVDGQIFFTSVEIIRPTQRYPQPVNGLDRDAGEGRGHLFLIDANGALQADIPLGEGDIYHPGGLDFDGRWLWIPVAEYRPDSRSIIYRVDPATRIATEVFRVPDHIGAVAVDRESRALIGVSWGGARLYRWPLQPDGSVSPADLAAPPVSRARSHFIAWQDCHGLAGRMMACTGLSGYSRPGSDTSLSLGGVELIDLTDFRPLWQTPILLWSPSGRSMLQNPAWFEATPDGLRAWFMPDDDTSVLHAYENVPPG